MEDTQKIENKFEKLFSDLGKSSEDEPTEEICKNIVIGVNSRAAQEEYLGYLVRERQKNNGVFWEKFETYSQHCRCLVLMSLANLIVKHENGFRFLLDAKDDFFKKYLDHFFVETFDDQDPSTAELIEQNFAIIIKKKVDQKELRSSILGQIHLIGGEYETKARRAWLHLLTNLLGNFKENKDKFLFIKDVLLDRQSGGVWNRAFEYGFLGYLSPKIQCFMSSLSKLEEDNVKCLELQVKNSQIYEEWFFHFNKALNDTQKSLENDNGETAFALLFGYLESNGGDYLRHYLLWVFNYLQKTVEKKLHFSVVEGIKLLRIENDEFYNSNRDKIDHSKVLSLRITLDNVKFLIKKFEEKGDALFKIKNIDQETRNPAEKLVEQLHLILKIMIPVNFLGGYSRQVQELFFPKFLDTLCKLLIYCDKKFYKRQVVKVKGKIQGVIKSAIGLAGGKYQEDEEPKKDGLDNLNLYPEKSDYKGKERGKEVKLNKKAFFELNTDIVRLASNLIHTSLEAQNFLIDYDYLVPLLSFTGFDDMNPLAREATIVLIRYVTDSNERAREVIRGLEVKKLDPDSVKKWKAFQDEMDFM